MSILINRTIYSELCEVLKYFPILLLVGPRQSGKTTLLKTQFQEYTYLSCEDPDVRSRFEADPRGFLAQFSHKIIFDEAQKLPQLFSYLQGIVDTERTPGRFILCGSQNFLLYRAVSQSLAGRVGMAQLLPLDLQELKMTDSWDKSLESIIFEGAYPGSLAAKIPSKRFYANYIATYIERDIRDIVATSNLNTFRQFIRVCAHYSGQVLNLTNISNDLNVSVSTVKNWISILEQSFIILLLPMYHKNFGKRLIKSPKLYFWDTGLLCHLLQIPSPEALLLTKNWGAIFETFIVSEKHKYQCHNGHEPRFYYFRDSNGLEIDLIDNTELDPEYIEIKGGKTFKTEFTKVFDKLLQKQDKKTVIYTDSENFQFKDTFVKNWRSIHLSQNASNEG